MRRLTFSTLVAMLFAVMAAGQAKGPSGKAPIADAPTVELKGKVARVQITPGEGMPYVEIETGTQVAKVQLGSMRYLMGQGFNPQTGDEIVVQAYKLDKMFVAITVTLPAQKKTLKLRDENGWPVWRGGRGRG